MRTVLAVLLLLVLALGCSTAPKPHDCMGQDDATAQAWADLNAQAKEARK